MLVVDSYSKWLEVIPMKGTEGEKTIDDLRMLFAQHGIPEVLVTDNGPQYISKEFELFLSQNGVKHKLIPPYHPASNGQAERSVQVAKNALKKHALETGKITRKCLASFLLA